MCVLRAFPRVFLCVYTRCFRGAIVRLHAGFSLTEASRACVYGTVCGYVSVQCAYVFAVCPLRYVFFRSGRLWVIDVKATGDDASYCVIDVNDFWCAFVCRRPGLSLSPPARSPSLSVLSPSLTASLLPQFLALLVCTLAFSRHTTPIRPNKCTP